MCIFACYDIPNVPIDGYDVVVNKPATSAYRAPGATNAAFAAETVVDEICETAEDRPARLPHQERAPSEGTRRADGPVYPRIGMVETRRGGQEAPALHGAARRARTAAAAWPSGFWFNIGLKSSCHRQRQRRRHRQPGRRLDRHRRHAHVASPCSWPRRSASRPRTCDPSVGRHRHGRLHRRDRRQPRHLRHRLGRLRGRPGHQAADDRPRRPDLGRRAGRRGLRRRRADAARATRRSDSRSRSWPAKLHATGGTIVGRASVDPHRRGGAFATHIVDVEVDPDTGKVTILRYTAVQDVRQGDPPQLRRGADAGRRGAGHRLGAERGVRLQRPRAR